MAAEEDQGEEMEDDDDEDAKMEETKGDVEDEESGA